MSPISDGWMNHRPSYTFYKKQNIQNTISEFTDKNRDATRSKNSMTNKT